MTLSFEMNVLVLNELQLREEMSSWGYTDKINGWGELESRQTFKRMHLLERTHVYNDR